MTYDGREVANFVLDCCDKLGRPVSNMALQKLVFFCHVWSLIDLNRPLLRHKFEAWDHGPVLQYLYHEFKGFGDQPISSRAKKLDKRTGERKRAQYYFDEEIREVLEKVVSFYGQLTASQLRNISHVAGGPWDKVWNHGGTVNPGMKLDDAEILEFYSKAPPPFTKQ